MSEQSDKLKQFIAITGSNQDRAKFFLESSAWDVEVAMSRYYENEGEDVENIPEEHQSSPAPTTDQARPKKPSNFATINTLTAASSDDDEEEGQAYYAGGSEHSGQQVLGPSKKKKDIVADMFKSVAEHGVETWEPGASGSSSRSFKGTGYKLGQDESQSEVVPGAPEPTQPQEITLRLWQSGFSINDGELREYADPANREFLNSIKRGEIPEELRQGNTEIHLAMEDHRMEQFKPSHNRRPLKAFQGQGYTLGSPAPAVIGGSTEEDKPVNEAKAKEVVKVDSEKPITSLQIRLADGTRLVGQFNQEHTVGQVRRYITTARPQYETRAFNLLTTYPSKVLDDAMTLKEAGLLNAAIMQKLT